jgi:hypothetical protein
VSARKRLERLRIADLHGADYAVYQARRSARLARAGRFGKPQAAADHYADRRDIDATILIKVHGGHDYPGDGPSSDREDQ